MIKVYSVCWGDKYDTKYVKILQESVAKHLTAPHKFYCITDKEIEGVETIQPRNNWWGWWQKLSIFLFATGPSLYFDLDVVITGDLDYLVPYTKHTLAAPANWGMSGHGGIQSSVLAWSGLYNEPYYSAVMEGITSLRARLWGDQEYLTELRGDNYTKLPRIYSYKYHCTNALPDDASVVCFHGKPDPHEVNEPWIKAQLYT